MMIDRNQELAEKYLNTGLENSKKGKVDLAIEDYTKAIELKPDYADAYYYRGGSWLRLGEWEKARSDLETARKMKMTTIVVSDEIREKYDRAWRILGNT
ncbi:tetratricopeptide repeat protein [Candidatus Poribacteria bacterium]|nr:tetratricopeptide repeat protein [Candidatus Poribacteria bacterium]MYI94873.1 tetratricopeptide repeat protein [Candidatus Poribacteria bacterium]